MPEYRDPLEYHSKGRPGKLEVVPTKPLLTQRDLSMAYSPGVAEPCRAIHRRPDDAYRYTNRGNLVAVVTNGTAVLGLGNIGPLAGKPVMEGKANLFKKFADIDVFDIEVDATDPETFIAAVKAIAPTFGGINLEDIRSPECFYIERRLQEELDIPVFHDDQHGTAIIAAAGLLNVCRLRGKPIGELKVVFSGAGAAAIATANLFTSIGVARENIYMCDSRGLVTADRDDDNFPEKMTFAHDAPAATLGEVMVGADVFIGLSVGGVLTAGMVATMAPDPAIFAMANPDPEIPYEEAKAARPDSIVATGRSDYPNQVNNVLGFPFLFRGALDCRARQINEAMKAAAVKALADLAREDVPDEVLQAYGLESLAFGPEYIIPKPFDPRVLTRVAPAVARAAAESGVAREPIADLDAYRDGLERLIARSKEFLRPLINRARLFRKRVVFPEGTHPRVIRAAQILVDEDICRPILVGEAWKIEQKAAELHIDTAGFEVVENLTDPRFDALAERLWKERARKGFTHQKARRLLRHPTWFACMMMREGMADGMIGGLDVSYADTLRPALQTLGVAPDVKAVSGVYTMLFKDRTLFFGDCTVNVDPDAETLAQIAINTAGVATTLGVEPRVALLSFSDFGEHYQHPKVAVVRQALEIIRRARPDLLVDGELQADTALDPHMAAELFPFSLLKGDANVLIFPDLTSGNIAYKLLRELGGATALGPLLVGLNKPVNALAIGSTVDDIVNMTALTVTQILGAR
jgi:malate dehydrogenase (oxaloacetate-decarboxylating)(NADP+)